MLEQILNFISQKYFYIPASVIGALLVIIPAVVKIAKIVTSNSVLSVKLLNANSKIAKLVKTLKDFKNNAIENLKNEREYLLQCNELSLSKKQIKVNENRIAYIDEQLKIYAELEFVEENEEQVGEQAKGKKKIRVKVKKAE